VSSHIGLRHPVTADPKSDEGRKRFTNGAVAGASDLPAPQAAAAIVGVCSKARVGAAAISQTKTWAV
jgi:hypothetical protein